MAVSIKASRFAFLPDDAPDPLSKSKKVSKGSATEGSNSNKSKSATKKADVNGTAGKSNAKPNKQSLHSLAFGGLKDGKKKGKAVAVASVLLKKESQDVDPGSGGSDLGAGDVDVNGPEVFASTQFVDGRTKKGPKMSKAQWEEWQRRDNELVAEAYENDLEQALIQSQLEFQKKELPRVKDNCSSKSNKSKKKAAAVPLNEFNAKMLESKPVLPSHHHQNNQVSSNIPPGLWDSPYVNGNSEEELVEKLRAEAKLEMERQKQLALEREILKNRRDKSHDQRKPTKSSPAKPQVDKKDEKISNLTAENEGLRSDIESYKERLKKVYNILQEAQELKDKAKLLYEVENLTKLNQDLNDEINGLHSQLEQERSKSHTALNECRKLMEQSRRRTTTEPSQ